MPQHTRATDATTPSASETTALLIQQQIDEELPWGAGGVDAVDVDVDIDVDELPIITRTNSFSLASPSFQVATHHMKVFHDDYDHEPEPVARDELQKLLVLVVPVVATYVLEYLPGLVCIMLVGHINSPLSKEFVDAATMSTMVRAFASDDRFVVACNTSVGRFVTLVRH